MFPAGDIVKSIRNIEYRREREVAEDVVYQMIKKTSGGYNRNCAM